MYPHPMFLKYEKVYSSLILVSKKRYVGYKVENKGDTPQLEGKGLEMQRRDGCGAIVKIM
jgi:DNA polymerase zeta